MSQEIMGENSPLCGFYPVDDELIFLLKEVRTLHIISVLKPVLEAEGYKIENILLRWVRFAPNNPAAKDFHSPRTDDLHAVYTLCISKYETRYVAIYQPFSHKVYVMDTKLVDPVEDFKIGEQVQFVLGFKLSRCPLAEFSMVNRLSRCFKLKKRWFVDELQLYAVEDRSVKKEFSGVVKSLEEAYYAEKGEAFMQRHNAMSFRK